MEDVMKPVIGITTDSEYNNGYYYQRLNEWNLKSISDNGGIPFMFQITSDDVIIEKYLEMVDGILFTGGNDVNPHYYGEDPIKEIGRLDCERDEFEMKLYRNAVKKDIPILGICRGTQVMNVADGGNLYQDINIQVQGANSHSYDLFGSYEYHNVDIDTDSKLYEILKVKELKTNSYHHQSVKEVAKGYRPTAFAKDGIIECIESQDLTFAVGIQWHPEVMYNRLPIFADIFRTFIKQCEIYHNKL